MARYFAACAGGRDPPAPAHAPGVFGGAGREAHVGDGALPRRPPSPGTPPRPPHRHGRQSGTAAVGTAPGDTWCGLTSGRGGAVGRGGWGTVERWVVLLSPCCSPSLLRPSCPGLQPEHPRMQLGLGRGVETGTLPMTRDTHRPPSCKCRAGTLVSKDDPGTRTRRRRFAPLP